MLNEFGFNSENIIAQNSILPIIYYRYKYGPSAFKNDIDKETAKVVFDVKNEIRKYLVISQIKKIFGQSTSSTLASIRSNLKQLNGKFKISDLEKLTFAGGTNLKCTEEDIESWFDLYEKDAYTFMILSLLYPNLKYSQLGFHQDHMHPFSSFDKEEDLLRLVVPEGKEAINKVKIEVWKHQRNTLANLQLLEGRENESKNDVPLLEWLQDPKNMENVRYLPQNIDYGLANFDEFIDMRKKLMISEIKKIIS